MALKPNPDFKLLFTAEQIQQRIRELARQISEDYRDRSLHIVCVLKGANMFLADLVRELDIPVTYDFLSVSSYGSSTEHTGVVRITKDLDDDVESRHVLMLEDIVDTGLTLDYLVNNIKARRVASLAVAAFLDRPGRRKVDVHIDYVGFTIPNVYVVGYGLDMGQKHRQYRDIYAVGDVEAATSVEEGSGA